MQSTVMIRPYPGDGAPCICRKQEVSATVSAGDALGTYLTGHPINRIAFSEVAIIDVVEHGFALDGVHIFVELGW